MWQWGQSIATAHGRVDLREVHGREFGHHVGHLDGFLRGSAGVAGDVVLREKVLYGRSLVSQTTSEGGKGCRDGRGENTKDREMQGARDGLCQRWSKCRSVRDEGATKVMDVWEETKRGGSGRVAVGSQGCICSATWAVGRSCQEVAGERVWAEEVGVRYGLAESKLSFFFFPLLSFLCARGASSLGVARNHKRDVLGLYSC